MAINILILIFIMEDYNYNLKYFKTLLNMDLNYIIILYIFAITLNIY